jgi:hypothetical protein
VIEKDKSVINFLYFTHAVSCLRHALLCEVVLNQREGQGNTARIGADNERDRCLSGYQRFYLSEKEHPGKPGFSRLSD